jgi:cytochrome c oxidase cbb3-type subunit 3
MDIRLEMTMLKSILLTLTTALLLAPRVLPAAPDGEVLYQKHCAVCHGDEGKGGVGVPLSLPSFIDSVDDDYLKDTIRLGRPGRIMPAFPKLSDAQINAIVGFMRTWTGKPTVTYLDTPVKGDPAKGEELFVHYCEHCHGEGGSGAQGTGVTFSRKREMPILAPALNNPGFLAAASDQMLKNTIIYGREGTPMSSALVLGMSEEQVNDVVSYIRSLQDTAVADDGAGVEERPEAVLIEESPYSLDETIENVRQAITSQNFTIIRTDYVDHGLVEEGKEDKSQVVVHFCNFGFLFKALAIDPRVGLFLPCRVSIVEKEDKVLVMVMNPMRMSELFNNDELHEACEEMTGIYETILEDAVL